MRRQWRCDRSKKALVEGLVLVVLVLLLLVVVVLLVLLLLLLVELVVLMVLVLVMSEKKLVTSIFLCFTYNFNLKSWVHGIHCDKRRRINR